MVVFKKKDEEIYIVTNYKVMYTTLNNQKNLTKVFANKKFLLKVILGWISPRIKFYILARNPFDRIISFYKDKFLNAEKFSSWMIQKGKTKWQKSAELFFPYLNLTKSEDPLYVSKKLMTTKFDKVISLLPKVYMEDVHMRPQYLARKISFSKFGISFILPLRIEKVFKIENKDDLKEFSRLFNVDLSEKKNSSKGNPIEITWDKPSIEIIEILYESDFKFFDYEKWSRN